MNNIVMNNNEDKSKPPFDNESEDEMIALSENELDKILSEAEIVQETVDKETANKSEKEGSQNLSEKRMDKLSEEGNKTDEPEEEFDISNEIDEFSTEDLDKIELEESDKDLYSEELEKEIESIELEPEEGEIDKDLEEDLKNIPLEADNEEEVDLDRYLQSVQSDIDLKDLNIDEEEEKLPAESPVIGENEDIFKETGIEGIEEEEIPNLEEVESAQEEVSQEEETQPIELEEEQEKVILAPEEKTFEGNVSLTEEEENILKEDLDLEAETPEETGEKEILSVTGEELNKMAEEEEKKESYLQEPAEFEAEEEIIGEKISIDKTLYDDIVVVLKYMDNLLGDLQEDRIKDFAKSKYFKLYKEVFEKLGIT